MFFKGSDANRNNNTGSSSLASNENYSMDNIEDGEVISLNHQFTQKSTLTTADSVATSSKSTELSGKQTSDKIKRHFRRSNPSRTAEKTNDQIVYTLDCEVESGHDNPGQQTPLQENCDKNIRHRKLRLSANTSTLDSKLTHFDRRVASAKASTSHATRSGAISQESAQDFKSNSLQNLLLQFQKKSSGVAVDSVIAAGDVCNDMASNDTENDDEFTDGDELNNYDLSLDDDDDEEEEEDEYDDQEDEDMNEHDDEIQDLSDLNDEDEDSDDFNLNNKNETIRAVQGVSSSKQQKIYDDIIDRLCNTEDVEDFESNGENTQDEQDSFEELLSGFDSAKDA